MVVAASGVECSALDQTISNGDDVELKRKLKVCHGEQITSDQAVIKPFDEIQTAKSFTMRVDVGSAEQVVPNDDNLFKTNGSAEACKTGGGKKRRKKFKRQKERQKKREIKQQQAEEDNMLNNHIMDKVRKRSGSRQSMPISPFTFSSILKPSKRASSASEDNSFSTSAGNESSGDLSSTSITPGRIGLGVIEESNKIWRECQPPITCQKLLLYHKDEQGDLSSFETQLSPLSYGGGVDESGEESSTLMERKPTAGRSGASSAPSTPPQSRVTKVFESLNLCSAEQLDNSISGGILEPSLARRPTSLPTAVSNQDQDWGSHHLQWQKMLEEEQLLAESSTQIGLPSAAMEVLHRASQEKSVEDSSSDDEDRLEEGSIVSLHYEHAKGERSSFSVNEGIILPLSLMSGIVYEDEMEVIDFSEIMLYSEDLATSDTLTYFEEDGASDDGIGEKAQGRIYTPGKKFAKQLQELLHGENRFFQIEGRYGEILTDECQYHLITSEQLQARLAFYRADPYAYRQAMLRQLHQYSQQLFTDGEIDYEKLTRNLEFDPTITVPRAGANTLNPTLQRIKARLISNKETEQDTTFDARPESGEGEQLKSSNQVKSKISGGKGAKWAAMRRKNNTKNTAPPKKKGLLVKWDGSGNLEEVTPYP